MQLGNIKNANAFARKQNADQATDDGKLCTRTQTSTTTAYAEKADANPVMSLTNIQVAGKPCINSSPIIEAKSKDLRKKTKAFRDKRLSFNVCGEKYEVLESTVQRYPNTLLADASRRENYWDENYQEFYLDRNRACFESVLTYYQSNGILIRPQNIPDVLFLKELQFYDLGEDVLQKVRGSDSAEQPKTTPSKEELEASCTFQSKVWDLFEHPETSTAARFIAWFSCAVVLLSIILFCVETLPEFQEKDSSGKTKEYHTFFIIETFCIAWFTFEYLTRLISSPKKWKFIKEALNVIDLIAILPFFLNFAFSGNDSNVSSVAILRAVRLVRVFRVFKLSRYSSGLRILGLTLRASIGELGLLVFFLSVGK